ncbi:unnamed protein product, partial [Amoebophrya sp. A25]|eukprot:GSA25T00021890001.1
MTAEETRSSLGALADAAAGASDESLGYDNVGSSGAQDGESSSSSRSVTAFVQTFMLGKKHRQRERQLSNAAVTRSTTRRRLGSYLDQPLLVKRVGCSTRGSLTDLRMIPQVAFVQPGVTSQENTATDLGALSFLQEASSEAAEEEEEDADDDDDESTASDREESEMEATEASSNGSDHDEEVEHEGSGEEEDYEQRYDDEEEDQADSEDSEINDDHDEEAQARLIAAKPSSL